LYTVNPLYSERIGIVKKFGLKINIDKRTCFTWKISIWFPKTVRIKTIFRIIEVRNWIWIWLFSRYGLSFIYQCFL